MSLPHSAFADHFRAEAVSRLRERAAALAHDLVSGHLSYSDVSDSLRQEAIRSGACYMPDAHFDALMGWLDDLAMTEVERAFELSGEAGALVASLLREPDRTVIRESIRRFVHAG